MKISVPHNMDDVQLAEAIVAARHSPVGVRALILTIGAVLMGALSLGSWCLVLSTFLFSSPAPATTVKWVAPAGIAFFATMFLWSFLQDKFGERHRLGPTGLATAIYELTAEGVLMTTDSAKTLLYWTPDVTVENDSQRLFMSFGSGALLVIPARAFQGYAEFEAFGLHAMAHVKAVGDSLALPAPPS